MNTSPEIICAILDLKSYAMVLSCSDLVLASNLVTAAAFCVEKKINDPRNGKKNYAALSAQRTTK